MGGKNVRNDKRIVVWGIVLLTVGMFLGSGSGVRAAEEQPASPSAIKAWPDLVQKAEAHGLPTGFLKEIPPDFVTVVFEDLHTYAAEYHPEDHRMILNLRLSFNKAGGALTALDRMTHHDLSLLYHELLHAYLDYLFHGPGPEKLTKRANTLLAFGKEQMQCHFRFLRINPVRQRRDATDLRFLSNQDSWEVLNETWAVFVGWGLWTKLELFPDQASYGKWSDPLIEEWATRLAAANTSGELLGYYEPDDPEERKVARKRFVAPSNGMTPKGAKLLLDIILEEPEDVWVRGEEVVEETMDTTTEPLKCTG